MTDRAYRALVAATILLWLVMVAAAPWNCDPWGVCLFDALRFPYAPEDARSYLSSLSDAALWRYLWVVQPLDLVFPALFCLSLREIFARFATRRLAARLGRLAVIEAGADYLENALIRAMLKRPDGGFSDLVPLAATGLTTVKWLLIAVLFAALARLWMAPRPSA